MKSLTLMALVIFTLGNAQSLAQNAYITNTTSNNVSVIDTATNKVTATIPVGDFPDGVAVSPDGRRAYITNTGSGTVSVIDTATNKVIATIATSAQSVGIATWTVRVAARTPQSAGLSQARTMACSLQTTMSLPAARTLPYGKGHGFRDARSRTPLIVVAGIRTTHG